MSIPADKQMINIRATPEEAHMIKLIREVPFGDITIRTYKGVPIRVEKKSTTLVEGKEGQSLNIESR